MRAIVDAAESREAEWVVPRQGATALLEDVEDLLANARRTDRVEQDLDAHAALRRYRQRLCERQPNFSGPVDVGLDGDRVFRVLDRLEHRGIEAIAVVEQLDRVPGEERNAGSP